MAPEGDAIGLARRVGFPAAAVDGNHRQAIGNGMSALYGLPSSELTCFLLVGIRAFPTDGSRVDEQFCALQSHETRSFRIPLIPAHLHAQHTHARRDRVEAEVAWSEVELLVIGRVIGDVHLAIFACY